VGSKDHLPKPAISARKTSGTPTEKGGHRLVKRGCLNKATAVRRKTRVRVGGLLRALGGLRKRASFHGTLPENGIKKSCIPRGGNEG